jgi:type IV secretion system protein VirD4
MKLMASFKLKGFLVVQSVNDIIGTYGPNNTIIDNSHIVVAFATADITSLERISRMTGTVTEFRESFSRPNRMLAVNRGSVSESEHVRPLMTPGDVRQIPYDQQLILINGTKPIRTKKFVYYEREQLKAFVQPPPDQAQHLDVPPRWRDEWVGERPKGERLFHPLAAKLRDELHRSESGPPQEPDAALPSETATDRPAHRTSSQGEAPPSAEAVDVSQANPWLPEAPPVTVVEPPVALTPELQRRRKLL